MDEGDVAQVARYLASPPDCLEQQRRIVMQDAADVVLALAGEADQRDRGVPVAPALAEEPGPVPPEAEDELSLRRPSYIARSPSRASRRSFVIDAVTRTCLAGENGSPGIAAARADRVYS